MPILLTPPQRTERTRGFLWWKRRMVLLRDVIPDSNRADACGLGLFRQIETEYASRRKLEGIGIVVKGEDGDLRRAFDAFVRAASRNAVVEAWIVHDLPSFMMAFQTENGEIVKELSFATTRGKTTGSHMNREVPTVPPGSTLSDVVGEDLPLGIDGSEDAEEEMAEWLAHPNEFGVRPKSVRLKRQYPVDMMGTGVVGVNLVEYEMPDGTSGRGFVNPITWSFFGEEVNRIPDDRLLVAYVGWTFLFPALQNGGATSDFVSAREEAAYFAEKESQGLTDIEFTNRYKIGTSELFEFTAVHNGQRVRGAGNTESEVGFAEGDPSYHLPAVYFLLGEQVMQ